MYVGLVYACVCVFVSYKHTSYSVLSQNLVSRFICVSLSLSPVVVSSKHGCCAPFVVDVRSSIICHFLVLSEIFLGCYIFVCYYMNNFFVSNGGPGVFVGYYTKGGFKKCVLTWQENKKLKWINFFSRIKINLCTSTLIKATSTTALNT